MNDEGRYSFRPRSGDQAVPPGTDHDLLVRIATDVGRLVDEIRDHERRLGELERWRERHTVEAKDRDRDIDGLEPEVRAFHDLSVQLHTLEGLVKYATGGSLLAFLASVGALLMLLNHISGGHLP